MFRGNSSFGQRDQSPKAHKAQFQKKVSEFVIEPSTHPPTKKYSLTIATQKSLQLFARPKIIFTFHFSFGLFERPRIPGISGPHEDKWGKKKELEEFSHKILCPKYWSDITRQMSCK